jgi:hypothetical protein
MKSIKAKEDFTLNNIDYFAGEEIELNNIRDIIKLNEKGFIEPLTRKDIALIQRELNKKGEEL